MLLKQLSRFSSRHREKHRFGAALPETHPLMATRVVNIRRGKCTVYIGREKDKKMHYGNPWSHRPGHDVIIVATREESIANYDKWLDGTDFQDIQPERRQWILDNLHVLKGEVLGCFCEPLACHGHSLARRVDA